MVLVGARAVGTLCHQNAPSCHQETAACDTLSGRWLHPGYVRCDTADTSLVSAACSAASASSRALICKPFACRASLPAQLAQRAVNGYTYVLPAAARKLRAAKPKNGRAKRNLSNSHEGSKRAAGAVGCTHQRHPGQGGPALRSRRQGHPLAAAAIWLAFFLLRHSVALTAPVARDISLLPGSSAAVAGSRSSGLPLRAALAAGTQARTHCWSRNCATLSRDTSPAPLLPSA